MTHILVFYIYQRLHFAETGKDGHRLFQKMYVRPPSLQMSAILDFSNDLPERRESSSTSMPNSVLV